MEDLKEKLICGFKNSEVHIDLYGTAYLKYFGLYKHTKQEYKEETVKVKTWWGGIKEKTITKTIIPKLRQRLSIKNT